MDEILPEELASLFNYALEQEGLLPNYLNRIEFVKNLARLQSLGDALDGAIRPLLDIFFAHIVNVQKINNRAKAYTGQMEELEKEVNKLREINLEYNEINGVLDESASDTAQLTKAQDNVNLGLIRKYTKLSSGEISALDDFFMGATGMNVFTYMNSVQPQTKLEEKKIEELVHEVANKPIPEEKHGQ